MPRLTAADLEMVLQLGMAIALSGLIGLEREWRGRAAGLRTMVLVCVGSTTMMLASARIAASALDASAISADPTRIAAGIITGVGFLGAGVILKLGDLIRGVTTSAAIWFVAGLGIVIGCKDYLLAAFSTALVLLVLILLHYAERLVPQQVFRTLTIATRSEQAAEVIAACSALIDGVSSRPFDLRVSQQDSDDTTSLVLLLRTTRKQVDPLQLVRTLSALPGVRRVDWR